MMTKLREMTFIFIWILVIAFVGLMVFEWGMDFTGLSRQSNIVGKINGNKITIQDFQQAVQNVYLQEREESGSEPDQDRMAQIRDQVWEQFIQQRLFSEQINKRHIRITDREISLQIMQNPQSLPPAISQNPNFMTEGQFDMSKYQQALRNPQIDWTPIENYVREILPFQKLQNLVTASVLVTEEEVKEEYISNNQKANFQYLHIPISTFTRDSVTVTEKEIEKYYKENKEDYKLQERRLLNYVMFSTDPTPADSQKIIKLAEEIKGEAQAGEDFAQLADEFSEDPSVKNNHGDLGYFEEGRMVKEFSDAAFGAKEGEIVGPVKTNFGIHVIKVHDKKVENGKEMVHASHILFKFAPSALTLENAQDLANNFSEEARDEGFKLTADKFKYEIKQTPEFTKQEYIPGLGRMQSAAEWTYNSKMSEVSVVYRSNQGYVILELEEIKPEGYKPLEEVKNICQSRIELEKRKALALTYASDIREKLTENFSFRDLAGLESASKVFLDSVENVTMANPSNKIAQDPEISAAIFALEAGKISPVLESNRGYYIIKVTRRDEINQEAYQAQRDIIRSRLLNQKTNQVFTEWYDQLKEDADIEDNRHLFFTS
jgi:parvulin-like peptidyl-prolyl isomerase